MKFGKVLLFIGIHIIYLCTLKPALVVCQTLTANHSSLYSTIAQNQKLDGATQLKSESSEPKPSVSCSSNGIVVSVPRVDVGITASPNYVMFKNQKLTECRAIELNSQTLQLKIELNKSVYCGSKITKVGPKITSYSNEVVYLNIRTAGFESIFNFTCIFVDGDSVPALPFSSRLETVTDMTQTDQQISIEIRIFRDNSFSTKSEVKEEFPITSVEQFMYVEVGYKDDIKHLKKNSPLILADQCFASFYPEFEDNRTVHRFINNGCADNRDLTVEVLNSSASSIIRFKFQMFKWVNVSVQRIYLFCRISLCKLDLSDNGKSCDLRSRVCPTVNSSSPSGQQSGTSERSANRAKRSETVDNSPEESLVLALGPIFPTDSIFLRDNPNSNQKSDKELENLFVRTDTVDLNIIPIVAGVVAAVCFVMIVSAAFAVWWCYKRRHKQDVPRNREDRIQPGFAFILRSSEDKEATAQSLDVKGETSTKREKSIAKPEKYCNEAPSFSSNARCSSIPDQPGGNFPCQGSSKSDRDIVERPPTAVSLS